MATTDDRSASQSTSTAANTDTPDHCRTTLKSEVEHIIAEYKHNSKVPPFSKAELVVMAILCAENDVVTKSEIYFWIVRSFEHYGYLAHRAFAAAATNDSCLLGPDAVARAVNAESIFGNQRELFDSYEIPLGRTRAGDKIATSESNELSVPIREGRLFLRNVLEEPRTGWFRFLDLPPELRVRIYAMALSFPDIGIELVYRRNVTTSWQFRFWEREHESKFNISIGAPTVVQFRDNDDDGDDDEGPTRGNNIHAPKIDQMLALLSVNKQTHQEALPIFLQHQPLPIRQHI